MEKEGIETAHFRQHLLFSQGGVSAALMFAVVKEGFPSRFLPSLSLIEGLPHEALGRQGASRLGTFPLWLWCLKWGMIYNFI